MLTDNQALYEQLQNTSHDEIELTPGDAAACLGNGQHDGIECQCDNCDHFLLCFPEWAEAGTAWDEIAEHHDPSHLIP